MPEIVKFKCPYCNKDWETTKSQVEIKPNRDPSVCYDCEPKYLMDLYKKYSGTDAALTKIGVPKIFVKAHVDDFAPERIQRLPDKLEPPGMLITGDPSIGKTHLAAALTKRELQHHIIIGNEKKPCGFSAMWVNVHYILSEIRQTFGDRKGQSELELLQKYTSFDFLVLDDLGTEKQSEWAMATICNIIDCRMNLDKTTLITTNLTLANLGEIDTRIAARLMAYDIVKFKGENRRKKNEKSLEF